MCIRDRVSGIAADFSNVPYVCKEASLEPEEASVLQAALKLRQFAAALEGSASAGQMYEHHSAAGAFYVNDVFQRQQDIVALGLYLYGGCLLYTSRCV